jgi:ATP phosphoribosyltransferase
MTKNIINIGLPSKGRLKHDTINIFKKNKLNIYSERGERDLFGYIKKIPNVKIIYLHARECIEQLSLGNIDIGFSGYDLFKESEINVQNKILINKRYDYGKANLVLAIPDLWIDVQTLLDLDEVADEFKKKKKGLLRVATKYPNLTRQFLYSKGVTQFQLVQSLGSTEVAPFTGTAEIISDITSTGATLKANNLRILKDGEILKSQACLMISKKSLNKKRIKSLIKIFSKK